MERLEEGADDGWNLESIAAARGRDASHRGTTADLVGENTASLEAARDADGSVDSHRIIRPPY